ncbi:MAG: hypothetical protein H7Z21_03895, partial [Hymenobacter sp.]|nr:hypothetical protein [Hymenobacter sp.]
MQTNKKASTYDFLHGRSPEATEMRPVLTQLLDEIKQLDMSYYGLKLSEVPAYQAVREQDAAYKGRLTLAAAEAIQQCRANSANDYQTRNLIEALLQQLLRSTLTLKSGEWQRLFGFYGLDFERATADALWDGLMRSPALLTLVQVAKHVQKNGLDSPLEKFLQQLVAALEGYDSGYRASAVVKIRVKAQEILGAEAGADALPAVVFIDSDLFGQALNRFVQALDPVAPTTRPWLRLLQLWQQATGGRPSTKHRKEVNAAVAAAGADAVRTQCRAWLELLNTMPIQEQTHGADDRYTYTTCDFLNETNVSVAKGLIWTIHPPTEAAMLQQLAALAVKCYRKIPGKGPLAAGLGNACLLALAENGLPGVAALARVRSRIKQTNTQELIARHIEQASRALGVSPAEIEDMATPDFGLQNGRVESVLGDYTAALALVAGKAEVQWAKAGKPLKAA